MRRRIAAASSVGHKQRLRCRSYIVGGLAGMGKHLPIIGFQEGVWLVDSISHVRGDAAHGLALGKDQILLYKVIHGGEPTRIYCELPGKVRHRPIRDIGAANNDGGKATQSGRCERHRLHHRGRVQ